MKTYPSDLTRNEYSILKKHLPRQRRHHNRKWTLLQILNAIFYVQRTGCQWRYLPDSFPPWKTVYHYWRLWKLKRQWEDLNTMLREAIRLKAGRQAQPSAASFDTQSVRTTPTGGIRGYDGYKGINGRKRFFLVDTLGLLLKTRVLPANTPEITAAMGVLEGLNTVFTRLKHVWADQGFRGWEFETWIRGVLGWRLELTSGVSKPGRADFKVAPKRWVVERSFAWLTRFRRCVREYEFLGDSSEAMIYGCMTRLMIARLARSK
jgi:putative transposase